MSKIKDYYLKLLELEQKSNVAFLSKKAGMQSLIKSNVDVDFVLYLGKVYTKEAFKAKTLSMPYKPYSAFIDAITAGSLFDEVYTVEDVLNGDDELQIDGGFYEQ